MMLAQTHEAEVTRLR